jgi:hypothetical protein
MIRRRSRSADFGASTADAAEPDQRRLEALADLLR